MVKYTREQRLRTVRLYERYGRSAVAVIDELGYPSGQTLAVWHRLWVRAGRDDGESLDDRRGERCTPEQKRVAVAALSRAWQVPAAHDAGVGLSKP